MRNKIIIGLAIAISFVAGFIVAVATTPEPTVQEEINTNAPTQNESEWRGYFVDGCVEEGATEKYCTCAYDWMRSRYTLGEMVDVIVVEDETLDRVIMEVEGVCREQN